MSDNIHHEYTNEIVCPYCGEEHGDSWERNDEGMDICQNCGKEFAYSRIITVEYSTEKIDNE